MRALTLAVAASAAVSTGAVAATDSQTCSRGDETRIIEVLAPGKIGQACDLRVIRDNGAYLSTPYHANNSESFCAVRARDILAGLAGEGFSCAPTVGAVETAEATPVESAPSPVPPETIVAAPALEADLNPPVALADEAIAAPVAAPAQVAPAAIADAAAEIIPSTPIAGLEQPPLIAAAPAAPAEALAATTSEPSPVKIANGGPVALSPTNASAIIGVRSPRSAAGRLIGAAADAKPLDIALDPQAAEERLAATPKPGPTLAPAPAVSIPSRSAPDPSARPRPSEDVIRSVLSAQSAAWNEGDLEAFMGIYWKDAELRFVSGSTVSKGWKETMKHYRDRYGEGASMGRLSYDGLDVDLVTDDVATVIGRYKVERAAGSDAGAFTLVMKRFNGLWRIVHDHTVAEVPATN